ncbi:MAG TPA: hypothetical protein VHC63_00550 [Acidimicrobiales bacterium]|nr:hypothetical protein [Acidimicrobiales bacterium]
MSDELLDRLSAARPVTDVVAPDPQLLDAIVSSAPRPPRRVVTPVRLASVAAVAAALVAALVVIPHDTTTHSPSPSHAAIAPNMERIAASTAAALTSGVAHVTYTSNNGHFVHDTGTVTVEFSGEDRSSFGTQDSGDMGDGRDSSFEFANKVVDGRFYLRDGVPGHETWLEDTNEHVTGSDIFSVDPRSLVTDSAEQAGFEDVGTATVDGVTTHHLKATRLDQVPAVNLGLGPIVDATTKVTKFDVWVDTSNVVRRLAITTSMTETVYPLARTIVTTDANGNIQKTLDTTGVAPEQRTQINTYSVTFTDIGSNIVIDAPANARKVAGQG